jgi:hypothetical protein
MGFRFIKIGKVVAEKFEFELGISRLLRRNVTLTLASRRVDLLRRSPIHQASRNLPSIESSQRRCD